MRSELEDLLRGPTRPTRAQLRHRRRRATALAGVAGLALLVGLIVGAAGHSAKRAARPRIAVARVGWYGHLRALAGGGTDSLDFEQRAAENRAVDDTLARSPIIRVAGAQHREMALTFDDGPGPYTDRVLDVLRRYNVPGTFFVVGIEEQYFHDATSRMVDLGFPIGDHTLDHRDLSRLSPADQRREVLEQVTRIGAYGAPFPRLFRPPYGAYDDATLRILRQERMLTVYWTIDSEDWTRPGVQTIVDNVVPKAQPGGIVLLHDAGGDRTQTVAALPEIITQLRQKGYRLVTVPQLLLDNPAPANQEMPASLTEGGAG